MLIQICTKVRIIRTNFFVMTSHTASNLEQIKDHFLCRDGSCPTDFADHELPAPITNAKAFKTNSIPKKTLV